MQNNTSVLPTSKNDLTNLEVLFSTPMMQQYLELKKQYTDCILFFRLGDFYEMFMEDAKIGAEVLDITLTARDRGKDGKIPMAGIPYHAIDSYLPKLVKAGYKVAVSEQVGAGTDKKLFARDVVRIVTPGTLLNEGSLDGKENNFVVSIVKTSKEFALALADISTGTFYFANGDIKNFKEILINELSKFKPSECVLSPNLYADPELLKLLKNIKLLNIYPFVEWDLHATNPKPYLKKHFKLSDISILGIDNSIVTQQVITGLLAYLKHTQKTDMSHIKKIQGLFNKEYVQLDRSTIFNMELLSTIRDGKKIGSLINYLDGTKTAMGGRLLRTWLLQPLLNKNNIEERYQAIEALLKARQKTGELKTYLTSLIDIERLIARLSLGVGNPRDLYNFKNSLLASQHIKEFLKAFDTPLLKQIHNDVNEHAINLANYIQNYIKDEPPVDAKNGNFINQGMHTQLDILRNSINSSKEYILKLEQTEKQKTGINSLKVKFNQVFGYYIEITKSNLHMVPSDYIRKQTLVNAERFITTELKHHEEIILTAEEKIKKLEYEVFLEVVDYVLQYTDQIQLLAYALAQLDCLINFSELALIKKLTKPNITNDGCIKIVAGRHPVVEELLERGSFVPNDTTLDLESNQLHIITGPNMAGKSVYIRQIAVIVLLAQIGCFVPVQEANISIVDKIFVRSGASDVISEGLSTFMVEMVETAYILNNATSKSLVIMDEIGRGTSTYDGISVAWSVAEYLVTQSNVKPKTLFATHYHELQDLEALFPNSIKNYQVSVDSSISPPVFLHKVVSGAAQNSFGVEVAKMAGIPEEVYTKANVLLQQLRQRSYSNQQVINDASVVLSPIPEAALDKIGTLDISRTTPLEALNILAELKRIWDTYNV